MRLICGSARDAQAFGFTSEDEAIKYLAAFADTASMAARHVNTKALVEDFGGAAGVDVDAYLLPIGGRTAYLAFFFHPTQQGWKIKSFKPNEDPAKEPLTHNPFAKLGRR